MVDENNCCKCTTPEITIKLNKQGPQGLSGPPGEPGFSPVINVAENTSESYKLNITTIDGSYETPNLKANIPSGGVEGTVLTKNSSVSGDASFKPLPYATDTDAGVVAFATQEDIEGGSSNLAVNSSSMVNYYTKTQADSRYVDLTSNQLVSGLKRFNDGLSTPNIYSPGTTRNILAQELIGADTFRIYLGDTTKTTEVVINTPELNQYFDGANHKVLTEDDIATTSIPGIVQPDGNTIVINNGVISAVGGGGGGSYIAGNGIDITNSTISIDTDVVPTLSGTNVFSGSNTFSNSLRLGDRLIFTNNYAIISNAGGQRIMSIDSTNRAVVLGEDTFSMQLKGSNIQTYRNSTTYTNIDSGNIGSYIPTINGGTATNA